jgi:hypothetical protein
MDFLKNIIVNKPSPKTEITKTDLSLIRKVQGEIFTLRTKNFIGISTNSPNQRYKLAWMDAYGNRGGYRKTGDGRYLLLEGNHIVYEGKMPRPNDGKVANNGVVILHDWGFSDSLSGTFWAFDIKGNKIVSRRFSANLMLNAISSDGHYAVSFTAYAENSPDANIVVLYDLEKGNVISQWNIESGGPEIFEFPENETNILRAGYSNLGYFRYSFNGEFLDRDLWRTTILLKSNEGSLYLLNKLINDKNITLSKETAEKYIIYIDAILSNLAVNNNKSRALALSLYGKCDEVLEKYEQAIDVYKKAISLDPKIAVKARLAKLQKLLNII